MTTKSKTITVNYVDCGTHGHFLPGKEVTRFLEQDKLVTALKTAAVGIAEYRITRNDAASMLFAALTHVPQEYREAAVPPSLDKRLGFTKYGILNRIAQDIAGTGPIAQAIVLLGQIATELELGLGAFLTFAERAPDANTERANALYAAANVVTKQVQQAWGRAR